MATTYDYLEILDGPTDEQVWALDEYAAELMADWYADE